MSSYLITASGCDDSTSVLMDLTDEEVAIVHRVADQITAAGGGCSPVMYVKTEAEADPYDLENARERAA